MATSFSGGGSRSREPPTMSKQLVSFNNISVISQQSVLLVEETTDLF
jgi:hypothetical protein